MCCHESAIGKLDDPRRCMTIERGGDLSQIVLF